MGYKRFYSPSPVLAAFAAAFIAISSGPEAHAQQTGNNAANTQSNPLIALLEKAEADFFAAKYKDAAAKYREALSKYGERMDEDGRGALNFRIASCLFFQKDWTGAEAALKSFLEKFPNGTGTFLELNNNFRGAAQLSLAEVLANQEKYPEAIASLDAFRRNPLNGAADRIRAQTFIADLHERKVDKGTPAEKKAATILAIETLRPLTQNNLSLPEVREAAYKLVGLYTKLNMAREATQLSKELEAKITNPADLIRANFLKLELGDRYFQQAESLFDVVDEAGIKKREELYRSAIKAYQGVHRRRYIAGFMGKAVDQAQTHFDKVKAQNPVADGADIPQVLKTAEEDLISLKDIRDKFDKNTSYDSILAYRLGLCLFELDLPWEARVAFKDILDRDPNFEIDNNGALEKKADIAHYFYIVCQNQIRKYQAAQDECKKFLAKYPNSQVAGNVAILLGEISLQQENYKEAVQNFLWARRNVNNLKPEDTQSIDYLVATSYFNNLDWNDARLAIEYFIQTYPGNPNIEEMRYMRALTFFYETKYLETIGAFNEYESMYPNGRFKADATYRLALVKLGINSKDQKVVRDNALDVVRRCDRWITDFGQNTDPTIARQVPEIYNLKADAYMKLAGLNRENTPESKAEAKKFTDLAIDNYVLTALNSNGNKQALDFAMRDLNKSLPARGEWSRLRDIYQKLYDADPNSPEALSHLYWIIRATEKLGNTPEERLKSANEAKVILAEAIVKNIRDIRQDNVENLIIELANKLSREVKRNEKQRKDNPDVPVIEAEKEINKLLKLDANADSLLAQARSAFARAELAKALRKTEEADKLYDSIARTFKADELSPTLLALVGEHQLNRVATSADEKAALVKRAEAYLSYLKDNYRSAGFVDFGFAGVAQILFDEGKYKEALELVNEAIESDVAFGRMRELRFIRARALFELGKLEEARKEFTTIIGVKEWRGEVTAGSKYYLAMIFEKEGKYKEAVNEYQSVYLLWKKYDKYAMKATYRAALVYATKLDQEKAAKEILTKLFAEENPNLLARYKATPEWSDCEKLFERLK